MRTIHYFGNPSTPTIRAAMARGELGVIETPAQGNAPVEGAAWCADNGCFSDAYPGDDAWFAWLEANAERASSCVFAVAPDVVGEAWATQVRSMPWLARIRDLGYPAAYVAQDGARADRVPWGHFDALFLGGTTEWKLGPTARALTYEAKGRGLHVHMGRVNSLKRLRYAEMIGCDSVDGTYLTKAPDVNLPRLLGWLRTVEEQRGLWQGPRPRQGRQVMVSAGGDTPQRVPRVRAVLAPPRAGVGYHPQADRLPLPPAVAVAR